MSSFSHSFFFYSLFFLFSFLNLKSEAEVTNDGQGHFNLIEKLKAKGGQTSSITTSTKRHDIISYLYYKHHSHSYTVI